MVNAQWPTVHHWPLTTGLLAFIRGCKPSPNENAKVTETRVEPKTFVTTRRALCQLSQAGFFSRCPSAFVHSCSLWVPFSSFSFSFLFLGLDVPPFPAKAKGNETGFQRNGKERKGKERKGKRKGKRRRREVNAQWCTICTTTIDHWPAQQNEKQGERKGTWKEKEREKEKRRRRGRKRKRKEKKWKERKGQRREGKGKGKEEEEGGQWSMHWLLTTDLPKRKARGKAQLR